MRPETPESCGNGDGVETLEIQKQDSQRSHSVLEISPKQIGRASCRERVCAIV